MREKKRERERIEGEGRGGEERRERGREEKTEGGVQCSNDPTLWIKNAYHICFSLKAFPSLCVAL